MKININSKLDLLTLYFRANTALNTLFVWWINAGLPVENVNWLSLFFFSPNDIKETSSSIVWWIATRRKAIFNFVIVWNKKDIPDVEMFEHLDILTNEITWNFINLGWFLIRTINWEWHNWLQYDKKQNPIIVWEYEIIYQPEY